MIWGEPRPERARLYLQLRGAEGRQRRRADALRLALSALHRRRAAEGRGGEEGPSHPEAGGAAPSHPHGLVETGRCHPRSVLRHRHHRRRGEAPRPPLRRRRARGRLHRRRHRPASRRSFQPAPRPSSSRRASAASRVSPSGSLVESGLIAPGATLTDARARPCRGSARRRHGARRRSHRLDPPCRRPGGRGSMPATAGRSGTTGATAASIPIDELRATAPPHPRRRRGVAAGAAHRRTPLSPRGRGQG